MLAYMHKWYTHPEHAARIRATLGSIDLDPASDAVANVLVGATRYFGITDHALHREWNGRVYVNHPGDGGGNAAKEWWTKLCREFLAGRVSSFCWAAFNLGQLRSLQRPLALLAGVIVMPRRREGWIDGSGVARRTAPNMDSAYVFFGGPLNLDVWESSRFLVRR